jgi:hypothetical protein
MGYREATSCCTCRKIISGLVTLALVGTGIGLAVYYLLPGGKELINENITLPPGLEDLPQDLWDNLPDIELFHGDSPWAPGMQQNPDDAVKWRSDGSGGLQLELVNALSSEWYQFFDAAVLDWDNGSPDSLTLQTSVASAPLPDCPDDQADGIMLVCNDDYGETDWKGINKVLMQSGYIIASTARMNDHFFSANSEDNKRRYTMCHEIGHGFGLPHTDETFWNRDLGNCLDYTTRYEGNMRPDMGNYQFLAALYGLVGGGSYEYPTETTATTTGTSDNNTNNNQGGQQTTTTTGSAGTDDGTPTISDEVPGGDNINRRKHRRQLSLRAATTQKNTPARRQQQQQRALFYDVPVERRRLQMLADLKDVDRIVNTRGLIHSDPRWNVLHQTEHGSVHEMDLGEGYTVQVRLLHP